MAQKLKALYDPFLRTDRPFLVMSPESSEMTKYVANCLLATKISFINEMANLCEAFEADVNDVRRGIGHDQRIGFSFLFPGVGYGGSCFPKDIRAAVHMAKSKGLEPRMMLAVDAVNEAQKHVLGRKLMGHFGGDGEGEDRRRLGARLQAEDRRHPRGPRPRPDRRTARRGRLRQVHDPEAMANVREIFGERITYCDHHYDALEGADALAIATEWNEFRLPDFARMKSLMRSPVIFDGRNLYDPAKMAALGFHYRRDRQGEGGVIGGSMPDVRCPMPMVDASMTESCRYRASTIDHRSPRYRPRHQVQTAGSPTK